MYKNKRSLQLHVTPMLVGLAFFMQTLDGSILNTALPTIARAFDMNPLYSQSLIFAYVITVGIFLPLSGWAFDRFGSLKTLIFSAVLFTGGSFLCASATSFDELVFYRIIQGIGGGLMVPAGRLEVLKLYPKRILLPILSFVMIPGLLGTAVGPALGGFIVEYAQWYWVFLINIPIGIIYCVLCYYWLPDIKSGNTPNFDKIGFLIFAIFSLTVSVAVNDSKSLDTSVAERIAFIVLSVILVFIYYFYAKNKENPLFKIEIFKIPEFAIGIVGNVFSRLGGGAIPFLIPLMLQVGMDYTPFWTGVVMLVMGVMVVVGKFFAPTLIKRFGYRHFLMTTTTILTFFTFAFFWIEKTTPEYMIYILIALFGILNSLQFSGLTALTLIDLPPEHLSGGNGLLSVVMQVAFSIGIGVGGFLLAIFSEMFHVTKESGDVMPVFHYAYVVIAILTFVPVIFYYFLPHGETKIIK